MSNIFCIEKMPYENRDVYQVVRNDDTPSIYLGDLTDISLTKDQQLEILYLLEDAYDMGRKDAFAGAASYCKMLINRIDAN